MDRRVSFVIGGIILLLVVIGGAFAIFHKPSKPAVSASTTKTASPQTTAANNAVLVTKSDPTLGQYFTEPNGAPLYTYSKDSPNVSNCTDACLASWPAYQDKGSTKNLPDDVSTIKRTDNGQIQFTYYGMPLYTFIGDKNGQVTGNGVAGFVVAKPAKDATP